MLKLYVDAMIRLKHSTNAIKTHVAQRNDDGFAAAEQIALAVAGVLIVGLVFTFFRDAITGEDGFLTKVTKTFQDIGGDDSSTPGG